MRHLKSTHLTPHPTTLQVRIFIPVDVNTPTLLMFDCCVKIHHKAVTLDDNPWWDLRHVYSLKTNLGAQIFHVSIF